MTKNSRRTFIKTGVIGTGAAFTFDPANLFASMSSGMENKRIQITNVDSNFEREPLIRPFGFKGGYMSEIWQTANYLESSSGIHEIGLCTQNVLWSDAQVFADHSESGGNALMYALTERALQIANGQYFITPVNLLENILAEVYEYGKKITSNPHLRKTFALNALVGLDNAAWLLYAKENQGCSILTLIPMV